MALALPLQATRTPLVEVPTQRLDQEQEPRWDEAGEKRAEDRNPGRN